MAGESELPWAVPRLVVAQVRLEAARHDLVGHQVVEHQDVGLLDHLGAVDAFGPEQQVGGDGPPRRRLGDDQRLEPVEPGELLVDAGVAVVAVVEAVGQLQPPGPLLRRRPRRARPRPGARPPAAGSTGPARWCRRCRRPARGTRPGR